MLVPINRTEFIRQRDGEEAVKPYRRLMRLAYRSAVLHGGYGKGRLGKHHPFRRPWIEGYLEFKRQKGYHHEHCSN